MQAIIAQFIRFCEDRYIYFNKLGERAGYHRDTYAAWKKGADPKLTALVNTFQAVGLELIAIPREWLDNDPRKIIIDASSLEKIKVRAEACENAIQARRTETPRKYGPQRKHVSHDAEIEHAY